MKIKKYFAKDMRKALTMAREEHGPDVVILSNRKVMGGVELIAADEYDENLIQPANPAPAPVVEELPNAKGHARQQAELQMAPAPAPKPEPSVPTMKAAPRQAEVESFQNIYQATQQGDAMWTQDSVLEKMHDEIHALRKLLEQQMSGLAWGQIGRSHPVWAVLLRRFGQFGLSPRLAKPLVEQIPNNMDIEKAWRMVLALLSYRIRVFSDDILTPGNVLTFVGSSGAGKTTTIAKLATRLAMEGELDNLILATTDSYRVGGRDHLRNYANIIGVPVHTIHNAADLSRLLNRFQRTKTIMIDTAGLSPLDKNYSEQLSILSGEAERLRVGLVVSACSQSNTYANSNPALENQALAPEFSILTKVDEADCIGKSLSYLVEQEIAVAYACDGQRVPTDIHHADAHRLITLAVKRLKQHPQQMAEEELEQIFGRHAMAEPFGE